MNCPICSANAVYASHRWGFVERGPFTWIGLLPFRCGQCQARFYRFALRDPRRRSRWSGEALPNDRLRAPRWEAQMRAAVMASSSGQPGEVLEGTAENASLEGVCVRLPAALPKGSEVDVSLDGAPATAGTVRWILTEGEGKYLHGINYHIRLKRRALHARPFRRWWFRRWLRRTLMGLIGLAIMALATYAVVSLVESLRIYDPWRKFYEPKGAERERYELQRRDEEMKRQGQP